MSTTLRFDDVSKRYRIGLAQRSLREAVAGFTRGILGRGQSQAEGDEYIWAVRNLTFELRSGETLGFIGRNGAGKTTTLKLLSGVTRPTSGTIDVSGRVAALIELGAGFHPDLTGRENVYLNGAILGMSRRELDRKFASIVAFAELEKFIDTPVKRYSSGMYARLGFAVAAHSDPDLLLIDEVLAVGDQDFQRKCFDFVHSFVNSGRTAVFVSHSMYVLEHLCNRLIWIEEGEMVQTGHPTEILPAYLDFVDQRAMAANHDSAAADGQVALGPARFLDDEGYARDTFRTGETVVIDVEYHAPEAVESPYFNFGIVAPEGGGPLFTANMLVDGQTPECIHGTGHIRCRFRSVPLMPRTYSVWGEVWGLDRSKVLAPWQRLAMLRFGDEGGAVERGSIWHVRADAPIRVPYDWEYDRELQRNGRLPSPDLR